MGFKAEHPAPRSPNIIEGGTQAECLDFNDSCVQHIRPSKVLGLNEFRLRKVLAFQRFLQAELPAPPKQGAWASNVLWKQGTLPC